MLGVTVRLTRPSRSRLRRVSVSIRWETLGISRLSSLNLLDPPPSVWTTSTVHLSPIRESKVLIVRHCGLIGSAIGYLAVPASQICSSATKKSVLAALQTVVTYGASVTNPYQGGNSDHPAYRCQHQRREQRQPDHLAFDR